MTKTVYKRIVYEEGKIFIAENQEELEAFLNKGYEIYEMLEITTKIKRVKL